MKAKTDLRWAPVLLLGLLAVSWLPGCEVGSSNDTLTGANGNYSGSYVGAENGLLVAGNSGATVSSLTLSQSGNQLQAVDNNGILFKGTLGDILPSSGSSSNASATFTLNGATTAGATVSINGKLKGSGATATMTGFWLEPDRNCSIYGVAGITPINVGVSVTPVQKTLSVNGNTQIFTASGGTASYTWTLLNSNGTLDVTTGATVTYTRTVTGDNSLTVTDSAGKSATAIINQP